MGKHVNLAVNHNKAQLQTHLDWAAFSQSGEAGAKQSMGLLWWHRLTKSGWVVIWGRSMPEPHADLYLILKARGKSMRKSLWLLTSVWIGEVPTNQRLTECDITSINLLIWHLATWTNMHMRLHILTLDLHQDTVNKKIQHIIFK